MISSKAKTISLIFVFLFLYSTSCSETERGGISTSLRFLSEDCSNVHIPHNTPIPSSIIKFELSLYKDNSLVQQISVPYSPGDSYLIVDNIEPYNNYRVVIRALTKDNDIWSGYADNVPVNPKSKTFVQINLSKEKGLTCTEPMNNNRFLHDSVLLKNGGVLIFGGANLIEREYDTYKLTSIGTAEIYYPYKVEESNNVNPNVIAGTFSTLTSRMVSGRIGYIYEILSDGKILIAGGIDKASFVKNPSDFLFCLPDDVKFIYDVEIFDPEKNSFSVIARLNTPRAFAQSAVIGKKIYIIGGINTSFDCNNVSEAGINASMSVIDLTKPNSPVVSEIDIPEGGFFAFSRLKISDDKYIFYGGNRDYALLLGSDGSIKKLNIDVADDFSGIIPQREYFPYNFPIKIGTMYLNIGGYYKDISEPYIINISNGDKISIRKDNKYPKKSFGSAFAILNRYLVQFGGIKSLPLIPDNTISIIKSNLSDYEIINNNSVSLKRERAFASAVFINENNILITGGLYFDAKNDGIALNLSEVYNINGIIK
jgi:hypothetical protein